MTWSPDYATVAEMKDYLRIAQDDTADDAVIGVAITAASRAIDMATLRQFGKTATVETRYYTVNRVATRYNTYGYWEVEIDDLETTTGLAITTSQAVTVTSDHYKLWPRNAAQKGDVWTSVRFDSTFSPGSNSATDSELTIAATWGWTTVPVTIHQACLMQASRWFARRDAPFGIAGSPESGSELRLLAKLDADVAVAVKAYYRWWGAR
jgi:hypothetical protein